MKASFLLKHRHGDIHLKTTAWTIYDKGAVGKDYVKTAILVWLGVIDV